MALFKISKGSKNTLPTTLTDGFCWYTYDDSKFYIDYKDENGILTRKALNAQEAERLIGYDIVTILSSSDVEIPTSKAVFDAISNIVVFSHVEPENSNSVLFWIDTSLDVNKITFENFDITLNFYVMIDGNITYNASEVIGKSFDAKEVVIFGESGCETQVYYTTESGQQHNSGWFMGNYTITLTENITVIDIVVH